MKALSIGAPDSQSGKTLGSMVLIRALKNIGIDIGGIKCGPDHIDARLLAKASNKARSNLDIHLQGEEGMKRALAMVQADYGLIEGVMGYFDGIGIGPKGSTYHISQILDIDSILVYKQKGEMYTMVPKIYGMVQESRGRIKGLILSDTSQAMYDIVRPMLEDSLDIEVLGYIGHDPDLRLLDASLAYDLEAGDGDFESILDKACKKATETLDIDLILGLFKDLDLNPRPKVEKSDLTIGVAKDACFSSLYGENLRLFEEYFKELRYFSPLEDKTLPQADLVYIGGGYVGDFLDQLAENSPMKEAFRSYHKNGGHILAETGGLHYLASSYNGVPMVGIFPGRVQTTKRLENFGYNYMTLGVDCLLGPANTRIPSHSYHRTRFETDLDPIASYEKPGLSRTWKSAYKEKNALGTLSYINFAGNETIIENIIEYIKR